MNASLQTYTRRSALPMSTQPTHDQSALKVNQLTIVALTAAGFIVDAQALPAFVAADHTAPSPP